MDIFGGIPVVEQRINNQGFAENEREVTQLGHFPLALVNQGDGIVFATGKKNCSG